MGKQRFLLQRGDIGDQSCPVDGKEKGCDVKSIGWPLPINYCPFSHSVIETSSFIDGCFAPTKVSNHHIIFFLFFLSPKKIIINCLQN